VDYVLAAGWVVGWLLLFRVPRLPPRTPADAPLGPVTVVIPARNEEANLPLVLGDLAATRDAGVRVVVVDDGSEDRTAAVAGGFDFVVVLRAPPPEPGWIGKSWACHLGAARAGEGTVVFVDADVRFRGDALARVVATCRREGGLVTVWPRHETERLYERLSALPTLATAMSVGIGSLVPSRAKAGLGPVMAASVADYRAIGGHASVRDDFTDDFAIARRFADTGRAVTNLGGGDEVAFRMYPHGLRALVEGWTKCLGRGMSRSQAWRVCGLVFWLTCSIGALTWAHGLPRTMSFVFGGLFALQIAVQLRQVSAFGLLDALVYPFHVGVLVVLLVLSMWMTFVRRRVRWRGRMVPVRARPREPAP
jgi:4,4'-diaponeurosporenoate glycosyltransferase